MDRDAKKLQNAYDCIYNYFKTTTEPFDFLEWDEKVLQVWNNDVLVETYEQQELNFILGW